MKDKKLEITNSYIKILETSENVMMDWEHPLMKRHAEIVCANGGDILEIGFGMGISANYIQKQNIKSHTIIEIHPEIYERTKEWSKDKPNVSIINDDWFNLKNSLSKYDGIFFDTYKDINILKLRPYIEKWIKPNGVFSYFEPNGFDMYNFGKKFHKEPMEISPEPNDYFNNNLCFCVWVKF